LAKIINFVRVYGSGENIILKLYEVIMQFFLRVLCDFLRALLWLNNNAYSTTKSTKVSTKSTKSKVYYNKKTQELILLKYCKLLVIWEL